MRKTLIDGDPLLDSKAPATEDGWLDLEQIATVEITSEDPLFPIEHALRGTETTGWRASCKGPQFIRLNFDRPASIRRIQINFIEPSAERSQELSVHARSANGETHEVVRQQFTFSPRGATEEVEDFSVSLNDVVSLEFRIDPDRAHDPAHSQNFAVLQSLRLA